MICPHCHLFNPPDAWRCDCGYDFRTKCISSKAVVHGRLVASASAKSITLRATVLAILAGTSAVCSRLLIFYVGLILGPFLLSPLVITLLLSTSLSGRCSQFILLASTLLYFTYFTYLVYFHPGLNGTIDLKALLYSAPIMVVFWITAGMFSIREQRLQRSAKNGNC